MRLSDIEKRAKNMGIKDTWKFSKKELIKTIQKTEGNTPCFSAATAGRCRQTICCWREDCLK